MMHRQGGVRLNVYEIPGRYLLARSEGKRGNARKPRQRQGISIMTTIARFLADEAGVTAVKYGLIAACISLAIVTVIQGVAPKVMDAVTATQ
jgi:pilus assembly protein Flp/PilA